MSKDVDRSKVFQTTRVRTSLKNDASWIQKSEQANKEEDNARTDQAVESRPVLVRLSSYVLSTAKKFESVDSPLSPPLQNRQFIPSEGPQAELIQNGEAQPEKSDDNTTAVNKDEYTDTSVDQSTVEHSEGGAEVSADVVEEEHILNGQAQPISSTKEITEEVSPVEPAEQLLVNTTAENKGENADTAVEQPNIEHNEVKVSADAHVEVPVAETPAAAGTEESKDTAEVPAGLAVKLRPQEEPSTESANTTNMEDAGVESAVQPAEGSCEKCPPEHSAEEIVEAVAEVVVKSSPDKGDVINATPGEEAALKDSVEPVPDLLPKSVSQSPSQPAAETATEGSFQTGLPDQAAGETVEAVAEVNEESSPETPAVTDSAGEEAALKDSGETVPDILAKSVFESSSQPAAKTATKGSYQKGLPDQAAGETIEAVAEVKVESSPETPAVTDAVGEEAALQHGVEPTPDFVAGAVSELPAQPVAETAVNSVGCKLESAAPAEQDLQTRAADVVECEVQPTDDTVVEPSVEPTPENAADRVLSIEDAVEPVTTSDAEAVQDKLIDRTIELSDALAMEPPANGAAPETLKGPNQSNTEETKVNQQPDHTVISEMFQKPVEELQSTQTLNQTGVSKDTCSFCDKMIDGNVRITFSEPLVNCHPDCLKCGVCAKTLGDMLTPMFLHNQRILCDGCFAETLKT